MTSAPLDQAAEAFAAELAQRRADRGLTKKQLAVQMGFDPSYVSHVESRRHRPTEDFARRAEAVLRTGGSLWQRYTEYERARNRPRPLGRDVPMPEQWLPPGTGLVVERETAILRHRDGRYQCTVRRELYNAGTDPVTRYPVRIAVDRYPEDPQRSNVYYRRYPLTLAELGLVARCDDEPMLWRVQHDRDAFKEVWLLFENANARFPLYPGRRTTIEYSYEVDELHWGQWFQRAVRLPTYRLVIRLDLPAQVRPAVWGTESTLTADAIPLRTPVTEQRRGDRVIFAWATDNPPLHARYRLEWLYREPACRGGEQAAPGPNGAVCAPGPHRAAPPAGEGGSGGIGVRTRATAPWQNGLGTWSAAGRTPLPGGPRRAGPTPRGARPGPPVPAGSPVPAQRRPPDVERIDPVRSGGAVRAAHDDPTGRDPAGPDPVGHDPAGPDPAGAWPEPSPGRGTGPEPGDSRPSERMAAAGITQRGEGLLTDPVRRFDLPREAAAASDVVARLREVLDRVRRLHQFGKGVGLAAPQIGIGQAAAVVVPPGAGRPVILLNPRVVGCSADSDERYEGCLSFFDVRGKVPRPLWLEVEHETLTGARMVTRFVHGLARLVAHEIDHLEGRLYTERMAPGAALVPVEQYDGTGQPWRY